MIWYKLGSSMKCLLLISVLTMSSGCCRVPGEPRYIIVRPSPGPLSSEILQTMQPDSTELLKRAESWSENSRLLLDSVNTN